MRHFNQKNKNQPRRQRTASSNNTKVFSYYNNQRSGSQTPLRGQAVGRNQTTPHLVRKLKFRFGYIPMYLALLAILAAGAYSLRLQPTPRVTLTTPTGTIYQSKEVYQTAIENLWRESLLNQTKFTVNTNKIREATLRQFGELSDVRVELPLLGQRPAVTLVTAAPAMQFISQDGIFYVNAMGKVMAKTSNVTQNVVKQLPTVRDESGISLETGKTVLPEPQAVFIQQLYAHLIDTGATVQTMILPSDAANQVNVQIAGQGYYVKFAMASDPRQAVGMYLAIKDRLNANGVTPAEYVDVRVEEKVFYR